jgi:hypothetical protein
VILTFKKEKEKPFERSLLRFSCVGRTQSNLACVYHLRSPSLQMVLVSYVSG